MRSKLLKKRTTREYKYFAEAWILLAISRSLILFRPFRKLLPLLGETISQPEADKAASMPAATVELLKIIQISILRAGKRSPWRTKCFEQALTARMMLKRRKIKSVIFFGVRKAITGEDKKLAAHAWLVCSGYPVTGGKNNKMFTVVARFWV